MVHRAGAGPEPIPHKQLTADKLAEAINICLKPQSQERAQELADRIASERGSDVGAQSFHQFLDVDHLRCNLAPSRTAVWRLKRTEVRLSGFAACTLASEGLLSFKDLKLYRAREYETNEGPWDPISGGGAAIMSTATTMMMGVADFPIETLKAMKIHPDAAKKKSIDTESNQDAKSAKPKSASAHSSDESSPLTRHSTTTTETAMSSGDATPATSRNNSTFNFQESLARLPSSPASPDGRLSRQQITSSMHDALSGQLAPRQRSRSRSRSNSRRGSRSTADKDPDTGNLMETAVGTSKGVRRIVDAGITAPMDFTMAVTKGFHNAPKLYGDDTVRKQPKVDDMKSGMKAATTQFGFGLYDGITGLVTQPMRGAKKEGAAGFFKGFGKGLAGVVLKPSAAGMGVAGYMMKGAYSEIQKQFGSSVQNYIIAARTAQGYDDWQRSTAEERREVVARWQALQVGLKKKRNPDEMMHDILEQHKQKSQDYVDRLSTWSGKRLSRSRQASNADLKHSQTMPNAQPDAESAMMDMGSKGAHITHAHTYSGGEARDADLDEAIKLSVQESSRGDADDDEAVAKAMKASLAELKQQRTNRPSDGEAEQLRQALEASRAEADNQPIAMHDAELDQVLAQSLKEQGQDRTATGTGPPPAYDPGHLAGTTQEEYEQQHNHGASEKTQQEQDEERVVMEYVKKQSALEDEHRRQASSKGKQPQRKDTDDEDLQQAMKMSMQRDGQHGEASGT